MINQRHFQYPCIHLRHHLRQFFFYPIQFGFGYFQRQFGRPDSRIRQLWGGSGLNIRPAAG